MLATADGSTLLDQGVAVEVHRLRRITRGVGELILALLAQGDAHRALSSSLAYGDN
jgi:hypothetical protein